MLKRRLRDAGVSTIYSNHSLRAAGITNFLENGGSLEAAQRMASHPDSRTTKLYDRRDQKTWSLTSNESSEEHRGAARIGRAKIAFFERHDVNSSRLLKHENDFYRVEKGDLFER